MAYGERVIGDRTLGSMRTASEFVPGATSGNATSTFVGAPPSDVWRAIEEVRLDELRATQLLMGIRSVPARVLHHGSLRRGRRRPTAPLIEAMAAGRFIVLHREPGVILTLGLVGQFWFIGWTLSMVLGSGLSRI